MSSTPPSHHRNVLAFFAICICILGACSGDEPEATSTTAAEAAPTTATTTTPVADGETDEVLDQAEDTGEIGTDTGAGPATATMTANHPTPQPSTAPTPQPTATPAQTPAATPTAVVVSPSCVAEGKGTAADFDGDGATDWATIVDDGDAKRLDVCLTSGDAASVQLSSAVWYLTAFDVEPDGQAELLFGRQSIGDQPALPAFQAQLLGFDGATMKSLGLDDLWVEVSTAFWSTGSPGHSGLGCVDHDNDGVRELVQLHVDFEDGPSTDPIPWVRTPLLLNNAGPAQLGEPARGTFAAADPAVALLGQTTCGDQPVEFARFSPNQAICDGTVERVYTEPGDIDGDGTLDALYIRQTDGPPTIGACTTAGIHDEVVIGGQGRGFVVQDVNGDGVSEIWAGDHSMLVRWTTISVVHDGRLVEATTTDGSVLALTEYLDVNPEADVQFATIGCRPNTAGTRDIVQLEANQDGPDVSYKLEIYRLEGATAALVAEENGVLANMDLGGDNFTMPDAARSTLAATAGNC